MHKTGIRRDGEVSAAWFCGASLSRGQHLLTTCPGSLGASVSQGLEAQQVSFRGWQLSPMGFRLAWICVS